MDIPSGNLLHSHGLSMALIEIDGKNLGLPMKIAWLILTMAIG